MSLIGDSWVNIVLAVCHSTLMKQWEWWRWTCCCCCWGLDSIDRFVRRVAGRYSPVVERQTSVSHNGGAHTSAVVISTRDALPAKTSSQVLIFLGKVSPRRSLWREKQLVGSETSKQTTTSTPLSLSLTFSPTTTARDGSGSFQALGMCKQ